jgi:hypothetical protein
MTEFGAEPASEWKDWGELRDQFSDRHLNRIQLKYDAEMLGNPPRHSAFIRNYCRLNVNPVSLLFVFLALQPIVVVFSTAR